MSYAVRESAMKELAATGELAESALRQALTSTPSAEVQWRVAKLIDMLPQAAPHPTTLAAIRSLEVLELVNSTEARKVIEVMSRGKEDPILRREAEQTLGRMKR